MQASSLSGVLLVDKPAGISSFGVIAQIRRILGIKKVGALRNAGQFCHGRAGGVAGQSHTPCEVRVGAGQTLSGDDFVRAKN